MRQKQSLKSDGEERTESGALANHKFPIWLQVPPTTRPRHASDELQEELPLPLTVRLMAPAHVQQRKQLGGLCRKRHGYGTKTSTPQFPNVSRIYSMTNGPRYVLYTRKGNNTWILLLLYVGGASIVCLSVLIAAVGGIKGQV